MEPSAASSSGFTRPVRLALWQGALQRSEAWAKELREQARLARARGAELLLTPELLVPGFHFFGREGFAEDPGAVEATITRIAQEEQIALCAGYAERRPGADNFWNTAVLADSTGKLCLRYRKHHLWGNEGNLGLVASDDDLVAVDVAFPGPPAPCTVRTSILICYDVEYPEMAHAHGGGASEQSCWEAGPNGRARTAVRILACAPRRAELILVPTALPYTEPNTSNRIVPASAMQNRLFIAYCNYPCVPRVDGEYFCGHSCVAGPDGEFCAGPCDWAEEKLLLCSIGWTAHLTWLAKETPYLSDRRPDFYASQGHCQPGRDAPEPAPKSPEDRDDEVLGG